MVFLLSAYNENTVPLVVLDLKLKITTVYGNVF